MSNTSSLSDIHLEENHRSGSMISTDSKKKGVHMASTLDVFHGDTMEASRIRQSRLAAAKKKTTTEDFGQSFERLLDEPQRSVKKKRITTQSTTIFAQKSFNLRDWLDYINVLIMEPQISKTAFRLNRFYNILIFLSVINILILSLETIDESTRSALNTIEKGFNIIFIGEAALRIICSRSFKHWLYDMYSFNDILVVIPWILTDLVGFDASNWVLEALIFLVATLRLLKITRASQHWRVLVICLKMLMKPLSVPLYLLCFVTVFFSCTIFFVEKNNINEDEGETLVFESVFHCMWFVFVTVSTVGYGDVYPESTMGKVVAVPVIFIGVFLVAIPLTVVGSTFWDVWNDRDKLLVIDKIMQRMKLYCMEQGGKPNIKTLLEIFQKEDTDKSGSIEIDEFERLLNKEFKLGMPFLHVKTLFNSIDTDHQGTIDFDEFVECLFPDLAESGVGPGDTEGSLKPSESSAPLRQRRLSNSSETMEITGECNSSNKRRNSRGSNDNVYSSVIKNDTAAVDNLKREMLELTSTSHGDFKRDMTKIIKNEVRRQTDGLHSLLEEHLDQVAKQINRRIDQVLQSTNRLDVYLAEREMIQSEKNSRSRVAKSINKMSYFSPSKRSSAATRSFSEVPNELAENESRTISDRNQRQFVTPNVNRDDDNSSRRA